MSDCVINIENIEFQAWQHGEKFSARLGAVGKRIGASKLGYNVTVLPPGKRAFPMHSHRVNEEMFFVLEGTGEIRIGSERHPIRQGDMIACPAGGPETAHQIINSSQSDELRYLAVSTAMSPEIAEYPDSGKVGIMGEFATADGGEKDILRFICKNKMAGMEDYWEGE